MKVTPAWSFTLDPQPLQLSVSVPDSSGSVSIDDQPVAQLEEGTWNNTFPLKTTGEKHVLAVAGKKRHQLFKFGYSVLAGKLPIVEPLNVKDLVVVSSLGKERPSIPAIAPPNWWRRTRNKSSFRKKAFRWR